jgi:hypothetical protein
MLSSNIIITLKHNYNEYIWCILSTAVVMYINRQISSESASLLLQSLDIYIRHFRKTNGRNRNYSAILATLQITSYALGV